MKPEETQLLKQIATILLLTFGRKYANSTPYTTEEAIAAVDKIFKESHE